MKYQSTLIASAFLVSACQALPITAPPASPDAEIATIAQPLEASAPGTVAETRAPAAVETPQHSRALIDWKAEDLSLWSDPDFKRRVIESYTAETDIEPRLSSIEIERMQEILERISAGETEGALEMLERYGGESASASFDYTQGTVYLQAGNLSAAAEAYEKAIAKFPKFLRAWRYLGVVRSQSDQHELAAKALSRVIELGGNDGNSFGMLGLAHLKSQQYLAADMALRMAIMLDPKQVEWKLALAQAMFAQERHRESIALCDQLIAENPESSRMWLIQASAFMGLGEHMRAAENLEMIDRLGEAGVDELTTLGNIYITKGFSDLGVSAFERAIAKDADGSPESAIAAAKRLLSSGARDDTRQLVSAVEAGYADRLEVDQKKDLLRLRSRLALADGASDQEAQVLLEIVELDPLDGQALLDLGRHAQRGGDFEQAVFYFERAESLEEFEADANVLHAQLLAKQRKYAEALPKLKRAQALRPRDAIQSFLEDIERVVLGK